MKIGHVVYKVGGAVGIFCKDWAISLKGQKNDYAIIQTAHRIEKGLTIQNPRRLWGWNKVEKLVDLIAKEIAAPQPDQFAIETGAAVLKAYREAKRNSGDHEEADRADSFLKKNAEVCQIVENCTTPGGSLRLTAEDMEYGADVSMVEKFFRTRHSARDFADKKISDETLRKAVSMALSAPSACNRQPTKVYAVSGAKKESFGFQNMYNADQYLIITADMNAFTPAAYGDWVVSASIFAAYLVLSLHALGIGSCILRKDMHFGDEYVTKMRKACAIPKNEKMILEIGIGYYKDEFFAAYSNRKTAEDILTCIR